MFAPRAYLVFLVHLFLGPAPAASQIPPFPLGVASNVELEDVFPSIGDPNSDSALEDPLPDPSDLAGIDTSARDPNDPNGSAWQELSSSSEVRSQGQIIGGYEQPGVGGEQPRHWRGAANEGTAETEFLPSGELLHGPASLAEEPEPLYR